VRTNAFVVAVSRTAIRGPPHVPGEIDPAVAGLRIAVAAEVVPARVVVASHPVSMPDLQVGLTSAVPSKYEPFCHTFEA